MGTPSGIDGARYDDELVYVASLLHDLQLEHPTPGRCFAVTGAERAVEFVTGAGATAEQAAAIGTAIATHITPSTGKNLSEPGRFIYAGASVDVVGARMADLDPAWVTELLHRHPRHNFAAHMSAALTDEAAAVPRGRTRWLLTRAAMRPLITHAPFAE